MAKALRRTEPSRRGRPPTEVTEPAVAKEIRARLLNGDTFNHIRRDLGVGMATVSRLNRIIEGERAEERKAHLIRIAKYVRKGSSLSDKEISDLIFTATGVRLFVAEKP